MRKLPKDFCFKKYEVLFITIILDRIQVKQCKTRISGDFAMSDTDALCSVHYLFSTHEENFTDVKFIYTL